MGSVRASFADRRLPDGTGETGLTVQKSSNARLAYWISVMSDGHAGSARTLASDARQTPRACLSVRRARKDFVDREMFRTSFGCRWPNICRRIHPLALVLRRITALGIMGSETTSVNSLVQHYRPMNVACSAT